MNEPFYHLYHSAIEINLGLLSQKLSIDILDKKGEN
jgi:hypothetical protein